MLIEFRVKNFRSFEDEAVLSMVASKENTLPGNFTLFESFGNRKLLHSAVIYGANAAGKTNLISAMAFVDKFINTCTERIIGKPINVQPFLFTKKEDRFPSEFEITFIDENDIRYQYGFSLTSEKIVSEWLIAYPKGLPQTWFERNFNDSSEYEWYFGRNLKGNNVQISEMCREDVLFLSVAASLNHKQLMDVYRWFQKYLRVIDINDMLPYLSYHFAEKAKGSREIQEEICKYLEVADMGVSGFDVIEETPSIDDLADEMPQDMVNFFQNKKRLKLTMHHPLENGETVTLPWDVESRGTQHFFGLSIPLSDVLKNGWILFVDELDSSLHPSLVRYVVELFHNPRTNPNGAQIVFNTHDTTIMDRELFRRDQIWFVEKDRAGCSHLYSLLEYSPRKEENFAKNYLQGRYGAIPFLGKWEWGKDYEQKK